jgi:predicted component of type VI protein secretion system
MLDIRKRQRQLVQILNTKAFREDGLEGLKPSTRQLLFGLIDFCSMYEKLPTDKD